MRIWRSIGGARSHVGAVVACALAVVAVASCASSEDATIGGGSMGGSQSAADPCATPTMGCACSDPGSTAECGKVLRRAGDYLACSEGKVTCGADGTWGDCIGDHTTAQTFNEGDLTTLALGGQSKCLSNPCDPYCQNFVDNPTGLDGGAGLNIADGGLALSGVISATTTTCTSLVISPTTSPAKDLSVNLSMTPSPAIVQFTASLLPAGCYTGPVPALWSVDKFDISQISTAGQLTLVTPIAGPIKVTAYAGTLPSATVTTNVTVNVVDISAAPTGATAASYPVTTGTADSKITMLYPYAATVFPLGLQPPLVQWAATGTNASSVKVTLRYPSTGTPIFSWSEIVPELQKAPTPTLTAQPRALIPASVWFAFTQTVARNTATSGADAVIAVQRIVSGTLYAEVPTTVHIANGQLKGKIYYNSYGTNLVTNYGPTYSGARFGAATLVIPPGASGPSVEAGYTSTDASGCRVCHTVAAGGTRMATNKQLPSNATVSTFDLTTYPPVETALGASPGTGQFSWPALSPDGTYLFTNAAPIPGGTTSYASALFTIGGTAIASSTMPTTLKAGTPAFSADSAHLAFNFYSGAPAPLAAPSTNPTTGDGKSLSMMDYSASTKAFSNFRNLYTPASGTAEWPSFLPPGENGVVFDREVVYNGRDWGGTRSQCDSPNPAACQNAGTTAELWWVTTAATPQALRLDRMNGYNAGVAYLPTGSNLHGGPSSGSYYDEVYNYEPTVLPTTIGGYSWVVFTSRRMYGNVATINPYWSDPRYQDLSAQPTPKKLWVAAISQGPTGNTDPSFPAFYLEGQELLAGNSRAYFVLDSCEAAGAPTAANLCTSDLDCCGAPTTAICQLDTPLANPPTRHCVATNSSVCKADGSACTADAQCCNFAAGSRCASGVCQAPPPLIQYTTASYTRDYTAACPPATALYWRFFDWQAVIPAGTSIVFTAQTADLTSPFGGVVSIGNATSSTSGWTSNTATVDNALVANGQQSLPRLRVIATLVPTITPATATPILTNWRQSFDCVPNE